MLDHLIMGATVVDGTGAPASTGDVGVRDGRIVAIVRRARSTRTRATTLDADRPRACAPGFVDPHTHYDAQLFWDPLATPSNVHGVTTVIGGNCGFTLAPLHDDDADYMRRMMAKVEGMPLAALEQGVPVDVGHLRRVPRRARRQPRRQRRASCVGHCALRRYVMGADAIGDAARRPSELAQMRAVLGEALAAGGLGFSTDVSHTHTDGDGNPVAVARRDTRRAARAVRGDAAASRAPRSRASSTAASTGSATTRSSCSPQMSVRGQPPAQLERAHGRRAVTRAASTASSRRRTAARELGGRVVALTMPVHRADEHELPATTAR